MGEEEDEQNGEEFEVVDAENISVKPSDVKEQSEENDNKIADDNIQKNEMQIASKVSKRTQIKPQFKEIKARSKFDIMRHGLGKMMKTTKKMVANNLKRNKRSKSSSEWENAISDATKAFHAKTLKAASFQLNAIKKESEKTKSSCQQSVNSLHQSTIRMNKANQNIKSFCCDADDDSQNKLGWMFEI